jgi:uncharacterized cupin superfamily protein
LLPKSANTLHKHIRAEEFYFVLEGVGRLRVGDETLTVPKYGGVLVGPEQLRQVFNDTDAEVLCLIVAAPEETEKARQIISMLNRGRYGVCHRRPAIFTCADVHHRVSHIANTIRDGR